MTPTKTNYFSLGVLQVFLAINAIPVGIFYLSNPEVGLLDTATEYVAFAPFDTLLIPGVIMLFIVGFGNALGAYLSFRYRSGAGVLAIFLGCFLILYIVAQGIWGTYFYILHTFYILIALAEIMFGSIIFRRSEAV